MLKFCISCLEPNTRPGAEFADNGLCIPCNYSAETTQLDWTERLDQLREICVWAKNKTKSPYDCLIPVSGGKDSTRQAQWVRDRLGLRPLLICVAYPPKQMSEIGAKNLSNIIERFISLYKTLENEFYKISV